MTPSPISSDIIGLHEKFLLYGEPGKSKTFTALTIPEPIYFLAVGGMNEAKTYFSKQFQKKHGKKEIYIDEAKETTSDGGRFEKKSGGGGAVGFDSACRSLDEALELDDKGEMEFASIIIDNASVLSEYQMNKVIEISHYSTDKVDTTYKKFMDSGILTPFDNDWMATQSLMAKFVSWLFRLPKNIVLIAHEHQDVAKSRKTQTESIVGVKPQFIGKQRGRIANQFDNVWRLTRNGQMYVARTESNDSPYDIIAKTRVGGVLPANYQDPDLSAAIAKFRKHADEI